MLSPEIEWVNEYELGQLCGLTVVTSSPTAFINSSNNMTDGNNVLSNVALFFFFFSTFHLSLFPFLLVDY